MEGQTKPWHRKQCGIVQNLCRGIDVRVGKGGVQKKSLAWEGTRRTENRYCRDRTSGERRKTGEVTQEVSEKNTQGAYKTCKDSQVLLGAQLIEATKSRQPLVPTSDHKPKL